MKLTPLQKDLLRQLKANKKLVEASMDKLALRKERRLADRLAKALEAELNGAMQRAKDKGINLEIESTALASYRKSRKEP